MGPTVAGMEGADGERRGRGDWPMGAISVQDCKRTDLMQLGRDDASSVTTSTLPFLCSSMVSNQRLSFLRLSRAKQLQQWLPSISVAELVSCDKLEVWFLRSCVFNLLLCEELLYGQVCSSGHFLRAQAEASLLVGCVGGTEAVFVLQAGAVCKVPGCIHYNKSG